VQLLLSGDTGECMNTTVVLFLLSFICDEGGELLLDVGCQCIVVLSCVSLIEFFKKMKKWADMASLPQEFRDKIERLERIFAVSMVTFKKFEPIFLDIFENPAKDPPRPPKSRKQKYVARAIACLSQILSMVHYATDIMQCT